MSHTPPHGAVAPVLNQSLPMLLRLREAVLLALRPSLRTLDLGEQTARVLLVLDEAETLEMGALADASRLHPPSLSRILPGLHESGWIESGRPDADTRRVRVTLSPAGRDLAARLRDVLRQTHHGTRQRIGETHAQASALVAASSALRPPMLAGAPAMEEEDVA